MIGRTDKDLINSSLADGAGNPILPALEFAPEQQNIVIQFLIECALPLFFLMAMPFRERPTICGPLGRRRISPAEVARCRNQKKESRNMMMRFLALVLSLLIAGPSLAGDRWEVLPPTPAPIATDRSGEIAANGIKIHYAIYGQGSPVVFLHGGLANTDY
jgi:hypothetical protein